MASVSCEISPVRKKGCGLFQTREFTVEVCLRTCPLLGNRFSVQSDPDVMGEIGFVNWAICLEGFSQIPGL